MKLDITDVRVEFENDVAILTILRGDDVGIRFSYGKIDFGDDEADPTLNFEYDIVSGAPVDLAAFEDSIAQLLLLMIERSIKENSTVFSGGV